MSLLTCAILYQIKEIVVWPVVKFYCVQAVNGKDGGSELTNNAPNSSAAGMAGCWLVKCFYFFAM